jgi:hypothetical protein
MPLTWSADRSTQRDATCLVRGNVIPGAGADVANDPPIRRRRDAWEMISWEYVIVALPMFEAPTHAPGASRAVAALNREGDLGWEAVGMTALNDGTIAVLLKRPQE